MSRDTANIGHLTQFHHLNFACRVGNLSAMAEFYGSVLGLTSIQEEKSAVRDLKLFPGSVAFFTDGVHEVHLSEIDELVTARSGHSVNPQAKGHFAFRTQSMSEVKERLEANGAEWSDYGEWAMRGWYQIYIRDPAGNIIEVHEVLRK